MSIISSLPFTLANGQTADATQVMANFNAIVSQVNANAIGPLASVAQGGTGLTTGFMPAGTIVGAFLQATAPTGWTQSVSFNDKVLRFVNDASGGASAGSWAISGVTIGGTAITQAQLPNVTFPVTDPTHAHNIPAVFTLNSGATSALPSLQSDAHPLGSTQAASTGISVASGGSGATHTHTFSNDSAWRPAYVNALVATKN